jgi:hypothetical protein
MAAVGLDWAIGVDLSRLLLSSSQRSGDFSFR